MQQGFLYDSKDDSFYFNEDTNLDNRRQKLWTSSSQPVIHPASEQLQNLTKFGLGVGALGLLGNTQFGEKRGWDYIVQGARTIEEYSPGKIFRTFQVSQMLSGLETNSRQMRVLSPELLAGLKETAAGEEWIEHVSRLTGKSSFDLSKEGFRFEGGQLLRGTKGSEVLLEHASVLRSPIGSSTRFQEAYARSLAGGPLQHQTATFTQKIKYLDSAGTLQEDIFMMTGGKTRAQAAKRFTFGYGTSLIERMNQLAKSPSEMFNLQERFKNVPFLSRLNLGVKSSSGLKTLGKLTGKLGILGGLGVLAYQELDYHTRNASSLDNTVFAEGITAGFATLWTRGQVALSKGAEVLGLHKYREKQEEIAPGSTELKKLLAFPLIGVTTGLFNNYLDTVWGQSKYQYFGLDVSQASLANQAQREVVAARVKGAAADVVPEFLEKHFGHDKGLVSLIQKEAEKQTSKFEFKASKYITEVQGRSGFIGKASKLLGKMTPESFRLKSRAALGLALIAPFIPGALVPSDRPEELEAIYSGQKKELVRKGRWWSLGRSEYEGGKIDRFERNWYPRLLARAKEKAIWGEDEPSPIKKWFIENFTYDIEKKHYRDMPYPMSSPGFSEVPILGPILGATIGQIVKPSVYMHANEWMREGPSGETETILPPLSFGEKPPGPDELDKGVPVSPHGIKGTVGRQIENLKEAIGFPGFIMETIKKKITGDQGVFDQETQLASSGEIYSTGRDYWDRELGDIFGTNELWRRLYPKKRSGIDTYNPIRNTMPEEWMPGPGDRSLDFLHGNPYALIQRGEERLPGAGYEIYNPEVKGLDPSQYPLINRYEILADVAKYSDKFKEASGQMRSAAKAGRLSEDELARYKIVQEQLKEQRKGKEFTPYKYKDRVRTPMEEILAAENEASKINNTDDSWFNRTVGSYWETLGHNAELSIESLTPLAPGHKLVHMRTAVEDYKKTQVFGTTRGFWDYPVRDFIKPFINKLASNISDDIPIEVREKRDVMEYFDILKYIKHTRLKKEAEMEGDAEAIKENEQKRRETLFGMNPYTQNYTQIFRALPKLDRDYFKEFTNADMEERSEIMKLVPENEKAMYLARWELKDAADMKKAIKKGLLSEEQVTQAKELEKQLYEEKVNEGFPKSQELWVEYLSTREQGESYPDWYRRTKLLPEKLQGRAIPGPDWVGFHGADLEDIKLKVVEKIGGSLPEYDLWANREKAVARRPYVEEAAEELYSQVEDPQEVRKRINNILSINGIRSSNVSIVRSSGLKENSVDLDIQEDRIESSKKKIRKMYYDN